MDVRIVYMSSRAHLPSVYDCLRLPMYLYSSIYFMFRVDPFITEAQSVVCSLGRPLGLCSYVYQSENARA